VVVTSAALDDMEAFLDASSTLEAEDTVDVVSQATGVAVEVLAEEGGVFRKGQVLARLAYEELELAERRAASELDRLTANHARAEQLAREQLITEEDYQSVKFDLVAAEIDWRQRKLELERTRILSPITGTVTQRMIRVGDLIQQNQAVYRVVDFDSLVAPVFIPEKYLADLHVGQPVILTTPALGGRRASGRVLRISPVVDSQSGTIRVTVDLDPDPDLRPGMFANVQLVLDRHEQVVVAPKKSIVYEDETPHVFVVQDGTAVRRSVEIGYQDRERAEIVRGVDDGDLIVLVGQSALKDGSLVRAEDESGTPIQSAPADDVADRTEGRAGPPTRAGSPAGSRP
jgi:membrane fusion protein (multidrug efflux system)